MGDLDGRTVLITGAGTLLTSLLLDALRASEPARIVNVASDAHRGARGIDFAAVRRPTRSRATSPDVTDETGRYYDDCRATAPGKAVTGELAAELWERSAAWTGVPASG